jgi:hypothetical protein
MASTSFIRDSDIEATLFGGDLSSCSSFSSWTDNEESENEQNTEEIGGGDRHVIGVSEQSEWTVCGHTIPEFSKIPFTAVPGPRNIGREVKTPLQFFQLFFPDSLIQKIVDETNRYAKEKISKIDSLSERSIWQTWKDVNLAEMKAFMGVVLNMAMNPKPDLQDFFSEDWLTYQQFFKDVFSRDRFCQLFWNFHVNPPVPSGQQSTRGQKIRNIVLFLNEKFREYYIPSESISVDESTVGFKGKFVSKMYNPKKPTKWGIRIYVLAESLTGYVSVFEPYYGSQTTDSLIRPDMPFSSRIVLHLVDELLKSTNGRGFHVYTDRFYSSYHLAKELLGVGIHTTGTLMTNRKGLPVELKKIKLKKSEIKTFVNKDSNTMVLSWKDKNTVTMISTLHDNTTKTTERRLKGGEITQVTKPSVIHKYNEFMGGVDLADHYTTTYSFARRTSKWWRKLFFWLLDVSVVNSFILYNMKRKELGQNTVKQKAFRKSLITELVGDVRNAQGRKRGRPSSTDKEERLNGKPHFIYSNQKSNSKDCAVCSDRKVKGGRRETVFYCNTCARKPGLHPGECFEKYHSLQVYR